QHLSDTVLSACDGHDFKIINFKEIQVGFILYIGDLRRMSQPITKMFTLCLILIGLFGTCISLKQSEVNSIMTLMKEVIDADAVENFGHSMLAPGIVRLIFHDCLGGCDGCIDKSNVGNAGLEQYIAQLEPVYEEIINNMEIPISHADFWTLASIYAIQHCSREDRFSDYLPQPRFRYGRKDCGSTSPYTEEPGKVFPDG
ncbi:unnamed protein product, partial [Owenia fusiformis]